MNFYQLYNLLNEYGQSLIQILIEKFKQEQPGLNSTIIRSYIDRFERIKNNLPEKDITKYTWKDLENTVDGYQSKDRIKAGKLDPTVTDANLLYNQNGIRIYLGKDKKSCIKYGNGYTFCISSRGEDNLYGLYRIVNEGTPYFIFNDNLPKEDNRHLMVLFVYLNGSHSLGGKRYSLTLASNRPEDETKHDTLSEIKGLYPWIQPIENFVDDRKGGLGKGDVKIDTAEEIEHYLKKEMGDKEEGFYLPLIDKDWDFGNDVNFLIFDSGFDEFKDFVNKKSDIARISIAYHRQPHRPRDEKHTSRDIPSYIFEIPSYIFYKDESDILNNIKKYIKNLTRHDKENFQYEESDEELKKEISRVLKFKFTNIDDVLGDVSYDSGKKDFVLINNKNTDNHFVVKIVNITDFVLDGDENQDAINNLYTHRLKCNKAISWIKNQSEEKLKQISDFYNGNLNTGTTMLDSVFKFYE
jgi:hypothetical protein